jgi:LuxR family maltose regulon positive regulatory protein
VSVTDAPLTSPEFAEALRAFASRPRLSLAQAWTSVVGGHAEAAGFALEAAERAPADAAEEPFEPSVGRASSLVANVLAAIAVGHALLAYLRGDADATARLALHACSDWTTANRC